MAEITNLAGGGLAVVIYLDDGGWAEVIAADGGGYLPGWRRLGRG